MRIAAEVESHQVKIALAGQADGPARLYAGRAERFRAEPPPDSWDGVTTLESK